MSYISPTMRIFGTIGLVSVVLGTFWITAADARVGVPLPHKKPAFTEASQTSAANAMPVPKPASKIEAALPEAEKLPVAEPLPLVAYNFKAVDYTRPLSSRDRGLYEEIFALQGAGKFAEAEPLVQKLRDTRLLGHVLEQRYRHPSYKTSFIELKTWLDHYGDHPGAEDMLDFAEKRRPEGDKTALKKPPVMVPLADTRGLSIEWGRAYTPDVKRTAWQRKDVYALRQEVEKQIADQHITYALKLLENDKRAALMTNAEKDMLKSRMAVGYYYLGDPKAAYRLASQTLSRSGKIVPLSAWIGGLISWREGEYKRAADYFEKAGDSPYASGWTAAAGAFWAARSHTRAGNYKAVTAWLDKAASHPRTFYGLLATRALGREATFNWELPSYENAHQNAITALPAGARAVALVDIGQRGLAQKELLRVDAGTDAALQTALLAYAEHAQLPKLSLRLANLLSHTESGFFDAALYPDGPWKPESGFKLDPALVYAIIRQESTFNPNAKSPKGALGLMQVMPSTAKHVGLADEKALLEPGKNLDIGQDYILELFQRPAINGDLVKLLVAYNAGPTNLANWEDDVPGAKDDPLLYIESIPMAETRAYIEKVMANYWMYQRRSGLQTPSLDRLAQGLWVSYAAMQKIQPYQTALSD